MKDAFFYYEVSGSEPGATGQRWRRWKLPDDPWSIVARFKDDDGEWREVRMTLPFNSGGRAVRVETTVGELVAIPNASNSMRVTCSRTTDREIDPELPDADVRLEAHRLRREVAEIVNARSKAARHRAADALAEKYSGED